MRSDIYDADADDDDDEYNINRKAFVGRSDGQKLTKSCQLNSLTKIL